MLRVEREVLAEFRIPVLSGTTVVVHKPGGLGLLTRSDSYLWALSRTQQAASSPTPLPPGTIQAAIPVPTGSPATTVTYIYLSAGTGTHWGVSLTDQYASHFHNQAGVGTYVTGFVPAQVAQSNYLSARLPLFEVASLLLILTIVAIAFRSLLAPLAVVGIAAVGYLVYNPLLGRVAAALGFAVPDQLEPVLLALLLGVVTDYCVLFFSAFRDELKHDQGSVPAARAALKRDGTVVLVAGLTVAGGTISLLAAPFDIFRALGPALALTVLVGLIVCLTLTPALMTILGWRLFTVLPVRSSRPAAGSALEGSAAAQARTHRGIALLTRKGPALAATAGVVVVFVLAALPVLTARLDLSFTAGLPHDDSVVEGADLLKQAGLRGLTAPTEVLVQQAGVTTQRDALKRMEQLIAAEPGVVRVLGPGDTPLQKAQGLVLAQSGNAARFIVVYNTDPLAATAISQARALQNDVADLARRAGLPQATVSVTGQTLIAAEVADLTRRSLEITLLVALVVELFILAVYLRALVAPLVLLACSGLSVAAALGLTTLVFQDALGGQGLTFYAPFASAVLLIALGSDYNVFVVGNIWGEAKRRPLAQALRVAVPRTSRAITIAGVILAGTFALVAIIPLMTFRQIAFAMTVGILIDTLLVRPVLTPAVLTLLGRTAGWPSRRITTVNRPGLTSGAPVRAGGAPMSGGTRFGLQVVGVLIGLFLVLWGADAGSKVAAEALIARDVQDATGATAPPEVAIRGRTFLLQLLRGAYQEVDVTTTGLANGPLRVERIDSRLLDVRLPVPRRADPRRPTLRDRPFGGDGDPALSRSEQLPERHGAAGADFQRRSRRGEGHRGRRGVVEAPGDRRRAGYRRGRPLPAAHPHPDHRRRGRPDPLRPPAAEAAPVGQHPIGSAAVRPSARRRDRLARRDHPEGERTGDRGPALISTPGSAQDRPACLGRLPATRPASRARCAGRGKLRGKAEGRLRGRPQVRPGASRRRLATADGSGRGLVRRGHRWE